MATGKRFPTLIYLAENNDARKARSWIVWDCRMEHEDACSGSISSTASLKGRSVTVIRIEPSPAAFVATFLKVSSISILKDEVKFVGGPWFGLVGFRGVLGTGGNMSAPPPIQNIGLNTIAVECKAHKAQMVEWES